MGIFRAKEGARRAGIAAPGRERGGARDRKIRGDGGIANGGVGVLRVEQWVPFEVIDGRFGVISKIRFVRGYGWTCKFGFG